MFFIIFGLVRPWCYSSFVALDICVVRFVTVIKKKFFYHSP